MINQAFWMALDQLIADSQVIIDRPKNSHHPKFPDCIYPVDYGYLANTSSMDGDGIDLWRGSSGKQSLDAIVCIVDRMKRDSEIKLLIGCTDAEREQVLAFHNQSDYMKGILILRSEEEK